MAIKVKPRLMVVKLNLNLTKNQMIHLVLKLNQIQNKVVVLNLKVMIKRKRNNLIIKQNKIKMVVQQLHQITLLKL
jgi:hypothetical protein